VKPVGPPPMTDEEHELVIEVLMLEHLLALLENDRDCLRYFDFKLGDIHARYLSQVHKKILADVFRKRAEMRRRGIKIYDQLKTDAFLEAHYLCRGYRHTSRLLWPYIDAQAKVILASYLGIDLGEEI